MILITRGNGMKLHKLISLIELKGAEGAVIVGSSNVSYFIGLRVSGTLVVDSTGATLYVPILDYTKITDAAKGLGIEKIAIKAFSPYKVDEFFIPSIKAKKLIDLIKQHFKKGSRIILDRESLKPSALETLKDFNIVDVSSDINKYRMIKDPDEIRKIEQATRITEKGLERALEILREGITEVEVASFIELEMRLRGAEQVSFSTIVASGPRAAYPHAIPTRNPISKGDVVIIDTGATYQAYCSDMTRAIILGRTSPEIEKAIKAVIEAIDVAIEKIIPGTKCSEVDRVARDVIRKHGLSKYFIHSTGHGVGIDVHEPPRLSPDSEDVLRAGMVVTIEPGIYVWNKYGVRIEELVLVTERGPRVITQMPRVFEK